MPCAPGFWTGLKIHATGPLIRQRITSVGRIADAVRTDAEFLQVARTLRGRPDFDFTDLVQELIIRESVPFLPLLRYKDSWSA